MSTHHADGSTETRAVQLELRAVGRRLEGYAAVYNADTTIGGQFVERIAPSAFAQTLSSRADVLALKDHDPAFVLGRVRSGTLRLASDSKGLAFSLDVPNTTAGNDLLEMASRGDVGGMSFGFITRKDDWQGENRTLLDVDLREISVVSAFPAYPQTSVAVRSRLTTHSAALVRARLLRIL